MSNKDEPVQNAPFEITIQGEMGEFAPSTKATAESCVRMKWNAGDNVYAYGSNGSAIMLLSSTPLTVTIEDGNNYVAVIKGTLSSAPSDNKLYLVHSPLLTTAPELSSNAFTVDMKTQSADVTPFVAYAVVDGVTDKDQYKTGFKTKFCFATSVLRVNATGIANGANVTQATISNIATVCKLTINTATGGFDVANDGNIGTVTKTLSGTASLSRASFYVGVPAFAAATI